ncbi:MAG: rRNA pseudouridine synthase [Candidatus Marinimicrobia bacterium]|nr:rRNA pseudouridine synthase [Candidatus Neomarinimicrobiota bacterium]
MRLNRYLAQCGIASRRACDQMIFDGRVTINDKTIYQPGYSVNLENDIVLFDGETVKLPQSKRAVILLNKPAGIVTTVSDEYNRLTVTDLVDYPSRLVPVGRLDMDTTGTLLLSDDGDLIFRLTHPKFQIPKEYLVTTTRPLYEREMQKVKSGIQLENGEVARFAVLEQSIIKRKTLIRLVMREGKKREIRRAFKELNILILKLHRISFAGISADSLAPGKWRRLNKLEIEKLEKMCNV